MLSHTFADGTVFREIKVDCDSILDSVFVWLELPIMVWVRGQHPTEQETHQAYSWVVRDSAEWKAWLPLAAVSPARLLPTKVRRQPPC